MPETSYALHASVSYFDEVVEDRLLRAGEPVQLGNSAALGLPVPAGLPYLARVDWTGPATAAVVDGRGRGYVLDPDHGVELSLGPVQLRLDLVPQFTLRRMGGFSWRGSIAWLVVVSLVSVLAPQLELLWEKRCEWFGLCTEEASTAGFPGSAITAEYLARLLREDYAGDDLGVVENRIERPDARPGDDIYLPAGGEGPITAMGGAEETAPVPVRTPPVEEKPQPAALAPGEAVAPLFAESAGRPIQAPPEHPAVEARDGVADAEAVEGEQPEVVLDPPAEERQGWGIPDWYDAKDKQFEDLKIQLELMAAKQRLKLDPDDPGALSVLSYYQYLAQDYPAAQKTYEHYIELFPEEAAGYNNMALVFKRLGDYTREENLYRVALSLEPQDVTALNNLAVNLSHQGRFEEALAVMKDLETLDPGDPYADLHRAKIYAEMRMTPEALAYLDKALKGMRQLDTLHHIEFRQDIRLDPSFEALRQTMEFRAILNKYYGRDTPLQE